MGATSSYGITTAYTNFADFVAATSGYSEKLVDFESGTVGDTILDGDTFDGVQFLYPALSVFADLVIDNTNETTSGTNYLGVDAGFGTEAFQDGDDFSLTFAAVNAVGMFFTTIDDMYDDDIRLSASGTEASLVAADIQYLPNSGDSVFFLGIVDTDTTFTSASIVTSHIPLGANGNGEFLYNVDDIALRTAGPQAVPDLGSLFAIFSLALGSMAFAKRYTKRVAAA